ncbi:50S ribosomal protein L15 [Candidatus Uhrbacteria bacterium]|nr:50S ribosomal protein L15 [Candidatus Uhrbacteria bacterium]
MTLTLHTLKPAVGSTHHRKRVGRGNASGHGTYSGKGQKGQRARSGKGRERLKRLGMKAMVQSTPKTRGFRSLATPAAVVNVDALERIFAVGSVVTPRALKHNGLVRSDAESVKILGDGTITKSLTIRHCTVSASAKEKIEKAGGTISATQ